MNNVTSIAVSALAAYGVKQAVTANNVANINNPGFKASSVVMKENKAGGVSPTVSQGQDKVEISKEAVDMIAASHAFKAIIKALKASDEMSEELLNIKA